MKSTRLVSAAGVSVMGQTFCSDQLSNIQGEKVMVSVDPLSPGVAYVFQLSGSFLCVAECSK